MIIFYSCEKSESNYTPIVFCSNFTRDVDSIRLFLNGKWNWVEDKVLHADGSISYFTPQSQEYEESFSISGDTILFYKNGKLIKEEKNIGILSEAGCPGIAGPGQQLVAIAQQMNIVVKPLVGPNSVLLALMASGMNGQQFQFVGYLPIDAAERTKAIKNLESESIQKKMYSNFY